VASDLIGEDAIRLTYVLPNRRSFVVPVGAPFLVGDVFSTRSNSVQAFKVGFNYLFNRGVGY